MLLPCEVAVKSVVPSIRAYIAKELTQTYKMKQSDVAEILGITQTAVSKYNCQVRGAILKIDGSEEIRSMMQQITLQIKDQRLSQQDLARNLCSVCKTVRKNGLMCRFCKLSDPMLDIQACRICGSEKHACT